MMATNRNHPDALARELLLLCTRPEQAPSLRTRMAGIADSMPDWEAFLGAARSHKVLPLAHRTLCGAGGAGATRACAAMQRHVRALRLNHRFMDAELERLLDVLAESAVPAVVFKGMVLDAMAFAPLGATREFGDIDLLVHRYDYASAKDTLMRCGYRMLYGTEHEEAVGQAQLMREDGRVSVDLHTRLAPRRFPGAPPEEALWSRVIDFPLGRRTVKTFDPDITLLMVCLQGAKERWTWLSRVCDLAWLLAVRGDVDWEVLMRDADRLGSRRLLLLGLALAHRVLDTAVPIGVARACDNDRSVNALAGRAADRFIGREPRRDLGIQDRHRFHFHLRDGWRHRLVYVASITPLYLRAAVSPQRWLRRGHRLLAHPHGHRD
jgi:hypothetical protein